MKKEFQGQNGETDDQGFFVRLAGMYLWQRERGGLLFFGMPSICVGKEDDRSAEEEMKCFYCLSNFKKLTKIILFPDAGVA